MTAFESGNCPAGRPGVGERALPYGFRPDPVVDVQRSLPDSQLRLLVQVGSAASPPGYNRHRIAHGQSTARA
jgi:hypothetical protein